MLRRRYMIGGLLILGAVAFLLYTGFHEGSVYYYTVAELKAQNTSLSGKEVRVAGQVKDGSVVWQPEDLVLEFTLIDENESIAVAYHGVIPDNLRGGADVVVAGTYEGQSVFQAGAILTKCPSKYVPQR